ncbi:hypothetical protein GE061_010989 [Apolygus lucorum]|uniref:Glycosyltransferase family 92 protein n=1 Tax=Apolygus lucorum TaxID=248454 RepID=A0A8S9XY89_APOLU|nr:hypothetical protein GE061_010989 [Apolygus lucorum]
MTRPRCCRSTYVTEDIKNYSVPHNKRYKSQGATDWLEVTRTEEMVSRIVKRSAFVLFLWVTSVLVLVNVRCFTQSIRSHQPGSRGLLLNLPNTLDPADGSSILLQLSPNIDSSQVNVEHAMYTEIEEKLPSLPLAYLSKNSKMFNVFQKNESCAKFPSLYDIEFNNIYWQSLSTSNGTFYLYSAYYDIRKMSKIGPAVRILAMINRIEPTIKTHCQFWFENKKEPVIVKVMEYKYIWYKKWGNYKQGIFQPYLIGCQIPEPYHSKVPLSVSIVEKVCDNATNNLRVIYNKPPKKGGFAVCVKGLDFQYTDLSVRMVEWIELLGLLGAEKIFFYELQVHQNISKVLKYYQKRGKIDARQIKNESWATYNVRNVYFLDDLINSHGWFKDIPQYMHMLQHVYRSTNYTKPEMNVKCFYNPERALILHNHFPFACLGSACTTYPIETSDAQLQHYRADCVKTLKNSCTEFRQNSILDTTIWKFKDSLVSRTTEALLSLGFFPSLSNEIEILSKNDFVA